MNRSIIELRDRMKALIFLILMALPVSAMAQTDTNTIVSMLDGTVHLAEMSGHMKARQERRDVMLYCIMYMQYASRP